MSAPRRRWDGPHPDEPLEEYLRRGGLSSRIGQAMPQQMPRRRPGHLRPCRRAAPTEDGLRADDIDQRELSAILREPIQGTDPPGGFVPAVAPMLTAVGRRGEQIEPHRDGDASGSLDEAVSLLADNAGQRLIWAAARALHSQPDGDARPEGVCT
ncbi:hypothetical protein NX794_35420 [Streptomyces sp. LP11]|uniref:Uncharacterized protein n=1 Tax=Streptomyces pyxinicus TaxID=2970331 RepID=A0ABT2BD54_9ACTN|nr:hypothetical protein [Streptomyces sp. LP11]MCS0606461.1 hypothetical protein [Streptomyces sp. LP11]